MPGLYIHPGAPTEDKNHPSVWKTTKDDTESEADKEASETEMVAARERAALPLEARANQFRDMLLHRGVSAFSTWEKELHKVVFDPRYLLLTPKERKQAFEDFVKIRAEEERKEKRNKLQQIKDDFKKLLEDSKLTCRSTFSEFAAKHGKDLRFKTVEKMKDRETLFIEFVLTLKKKEKEHARSKADRKKEREFNDYIREKFITAKSEFRNLLKETKFITYRSNKLLRESDQHLRDIEKILQNDKRYLVLDCVPEERRKMVVSYVEDLDRRGPPPPPTASEPARRSNKVAVILDIWQ
uniref:transcription elongation regulator 1-like isoform X2 n=1 Tax=Myxine glutinosa TaxID=7769 RepID=UPI00358FB158